MTSLLLITAVVLGGNAQEVQNHENDSLQQPVMVYASESLSPSLFDKNVRERERDVVIQAANYQAEPSTLAPVTKARPTPATRPVSTRSIAKANLAWKQNESPSDAVDSSMAPPAPITYDSQEKTPHYFSSDTSGCGCDTGCPSDCGECGNCGACGHGGLLHGCGGLGLHHGGYWAKHCLPSPWHAPGNMTPRYPYEAYPQTYYYFRPYNMLHIPQQQEIARGWVDDPGLPYSNGVFAKVYAEYEADLINTPEPIRPMSYNQPRR
ncbi:MAG: hypothetical protein WDZ51_03275 [Pirellulaceae bacterium]